MIAPTRKTLRRGAMPLLLTAVALSAGPAAATALPNVRGSSPQPKITGGRSDPYGNTKWIASVLRVNKRTVSFCGGSLIARRYVLTAAHCARQNYRRDLVVRIGSKRLGRGGFVRGVSDVFRYPHYDPRTNYGDLAILKLSRPVPLRPAHLVPSGTSYATDPPSNRAYIAGWGQTRNGGGLARKLRSAWIRMLPDRVCNGLQPPFNGSVMVCAGNPPKDTCHGDSGGPLAVWDGSWWELVGVTSYGRNRCGIAPAAYSWIGSPVLHRWLDGFVRGSAGP